jgi:hypothetical protein
MYILWPWLFTYIVNVLHILWSWLLYVYCDPDFLPCTAIVTVVHTYPILLWLWLLLSYIFCDRDCPPCISCLVIVTVTHTLCSNGPTYSRVYVLWSWLSYCRCTYCDRDCLHILWSSLSYIYFGRDGFTYRDCNNTYFCDCDCPPYISIMIVLYILWWLT